MPAPGRDCPLHYRYRPEVFARAPDLRADTLLVAGGLYGNLPALETLQHIIEPGAKLVFNGDFNWFNIDSAAYLTINDAVLRHTAIRGNVETELAARQSDADCGCAYPYDVDDAEVDRSNRIMQRVRQTASAFPALRSRLAALPMHLVAQVGTVRVAVTHGDARSLAGWDFAHHRLHGPGSRDMLDQNFRRSNVRVFASSHTCLPALRTLQSSDRTRAVINNGAAGMPNFSETRFGVATRISILPCPPALRLYGTRIDNVFVDAIKIHYDHRAFAEQFESNWPAGSPAYMSYFSRIVHGPAFSPDQAIGTPSVQPIRRRA